MRKRRWIAACGWLGGVILGGVLWYLASVGLERADKLGSVISALSGLAALGVSALGLLGSAGSVDRPRPSASPPYDSYVEALLATNRSPEWNRDLCSTEQLESVGLHYTPVDDDRPPAFTEHLYKLNRGLLDSRRESLERVARRLHDDTRHNITVLLGDPGAGKSSFSVQLVHLVALRHRKRLTPVLPVYINLAHFDGRYAATAEGLAEFVVDAISQACPRHQVRSAGAEYLRTIGQTLLEGEPPTPILFVFDGVDEMSTSDYVRRVRAIAGFMDDPRRQNFTFVVTCRYADFVQLQDYTNNLRLQRWDLLPWTRRMALDYLRSTRRGGTELPDGRKFYNPLEVMLRGEVVEPETRTGLSGMWDDYLRARLAGEVPDVDRAIAELARSAYEQTWPSAWRPSPDVLDAARRVGLLRGEAFEIRPLEHHLAGRELWKRIREDGTFPREVRLDDINPREALKSAGAQAGDDPRWSAAVSTALREPAGKRTLGDRLSVAAHVLTPTHIASSPELRARLVEVVAALVATDDVERVRCLEALSRQPELIDPDLPDTADLFEWIASRGSPGAVGWLLELLIRHRGLRRQYRQILLRTVNRVLDEGRATRQTQALLARFLPNGRWVRPMLGIGRVVLVVLGYYLTYAVAWTAALLLLIPVYEAMAPRRLQRLGFTGLWAWGHTVIPLLGSLWAARELLRPRQEEGTGPQRWWMRFLSYLVIVFGVRLTWEVMQILGTTPPQAWQARSEALLIVTPFVAVVIAVILLQRVKTTRQEPVATSSPSSADRIVREGAGNKPLVLIVLATIGGTGLTLFAGDAVWAVVVGVAGTVLVFVEARLWKPLRSARRAKRRMRELVREGLSADVHSAVTDIFGKIADTSRPTWERNAYVDSLSEVHFDDELRQDLEALYDDLPPGPVYARLTYVVLQAHHEYLKGRRPG